MSVFALSWIFSFSDSVSSRRLKSILSSVYLKKKKEVAINFNIEKGLLLWYL